MPGLGLLIAGPARDHHRRLCDPGGRACAALVILALSLTPFCMVLFGDLLNLPIPIFPQSFANLFPADWSQKDVLRATAGIMAAAAAPGSLPHAAPPVRHPDRRGRSQRENLMGDLLLQSQSRLFGRAQPSRTSASPSWAASSARWSACCPGSGPIATIAMLLPITFGLDPVGALIMLAGIYYGAQYGGSTTAILVNIPGRGDLRGHGARRPPDGAPGPRRRGARHRGHRLVLRRHASRPS